MKAAKTMVSGLTMAELKALIHEFIAEDMGTWRETLAMMADRKLIKGIREADADWNAGNLANYSSWPDYKHTSP